jgi:hypothetical protein
MPLLCILRYKGSLASCKSLSQTYFTTGNYFVLTTSPLRLMTSNFISQQNACGYIPYVTSCLRRGWVCRLQLLLVLASTIILKSKSRGTHDYILLSQIRETPNLEKVKLERKRSH